MEAAAPGYYHAEGDPIGTVRYWDGSSWTTEPISPHAPQVSPPPPVGSMTVVDRERFGGPGARVGAALIDTVVYVAGVLVVAIPIGVATEPGIGFLVGAAMVLVMWFGFVAITASVGWTPGKLSMGLRVTTADGVTTPPGWGPAFVRTLPSLVGAFPVIGGFLNLALQVINVILVHNDDERRSVHDRAGQTRVVKVDRLKAL